MEIFYGVYWAFLAMICWGVADYFARTATIQLGSAIRASFYVHVIGLFVPLIIFVYQLASSQSGEIDFVLLFTYGPLAGLLFTLNYVLYYRGLSTGSVSIVTAVASAFVVVAVILSAILLHESFSMFQFLLVVLITLGISLTSFKNTTIGSSTGLKYALPCMFIIGVAVCIVKPLVQGVGPVLATIVPMLVSSLLTWIWAIKMGIPLSFSVNNGLKNVSIAGILDSGGFLCISMGFVLAPVFIVTPISAASPMVTIFLVRVFIGERIAKLQSFGVILTIAGVLILSAVSN